MPAVKRLGILNVAGSLMPQTAAQIAHLELKRVPSLVLDTSRLFAPEECEGEIARLATAVSAVYTGMPLAH